MAPDPRSGLDADGTTFVAQFPGQRPPFALGNDLGLRHGAYSLRISAAAKEKADQIREVCPVHSAADEYVITSLGIVLVRIERAQAALDQVDEDADRNGKGPLSAYLGAGTKLDTLRADLRSWLNTAERYFAALGLTPLSRAKLGLDVARTEDVLADLAREGRRIRLAREEAS